jgi:VWFA-related protein
MVQVDVIAKDHYGLPVSDLKQSDFTIYDNGKKQEIAWFSLETDKTRNLPAPPVAPDTYSNLVEQRTGVPGNLTIILLDFLNTSHTDMVSARSQVMKLLQQLRPEDRVAIYALYSKLIVLHDFTNDASSLARTIQNYDTTESSDLRAVSSMPIFSGNALGDASENGFLTQAFESMSDFANVDRMYTTTMAFEDISEHMVRIPGRKNLIWVSGSFPFSINLDVDAEAGPNFAGPGALSKAASPVPNSVTTSANTAGGLLAGTQGLNIVEKREFAEEISQAIQDLANANIAMYSVDAHGLVASGEEYSVDQNTITGAAKTIMPNVGGDPATTPGSMLSASFDTMFNLAEYTGGIAFASTNDLGGAVKKAMEDGRVSYMIAYYPALLDAKGKFHNIKVKVNRPGVELRYRSGYFPAPFSYTQQANTAPIITQALSSPLDATGLGMTVHAMAISTNNEKTLGLTLDFDQGDVTFGYDQGRTVGTVRVVLEQFDTEGKDLGGETTTVKMHLDKDTYGRVRQDGLRFRRNLPLKAEAVELKVVACDDKSGAVGSISIPLAKYFPATGH